MAAPRSRSAVSRRQGPRRGDRSVAPTLIGPRFVLIVAAVAFWWLRNAGIVEAPVAPATVTQAQPTPAPPALSAEERALLVRVDKEWALAPDYVPPDLVPVTGVAQALPGQRVRTVALTALQRLATEAQKEGHALSVRSGYRSYTEQATTYTYWVAQLGAVEAARVSARAGHSEHQLGTAVDLTSAAVGYDLVEGFGGTPEGRWLASNGQRFGFTLSYPEGKEAVTGYAYEPWHWRYVGEAMATWLRERGLTLTEWLREGGDPKTTRVRAGPPLLAAARPSPYRVA